MTAPAGWYPDPQNPAGFRWWDGVAWSGPFVAPAQLNELIATLQTEVADLRRQADHLRRDIVQSSDAMLLQEVGIYEYSHPLDSAAAYKELLTDVEVRCREAVKNGTAVSSTKKWAINGSEKEGMKMVSDFSKLILRAYNNEADNVLRTMRPYTLEAALSRLEKLRVSIAKLGASMRLAITDSYHQLRLQEIRLTADYLAKVAEQKEREREERARLKEEEIARREFEAEQARLEKEQTHYETVVAALMAKGDTAAVAQAQERLAQIKQALDGVINRAANIRAGYVYVISNIGAFGERVVKIGLTRRLEPMDRVRELGDASVPFRYDVHALIFSEDAVGLETALHHEFSRHRVNLVNARREFFYISPLEVKDALRRLNGELLTYEDAAEAIEWRQSETARRAAASRSVASGTQPAHAPVLEIRD